MIPKQNSLGKSRGFRNAGPWWLRIGAKIVLARLPVPYSMWKRIGVFEHGDMNLPERALNTFLQLAGSAGVLDLALPPSQLRFGQDFNVLELGPGDSVFSAVIAKSLNASHTWLIDAGPYATTDPTDYIKLFDFLRQRGLLVYNDTQHNSISSILKAYNAQYCTKGIPSLGNIPSHSIDYCFSNAVLEHIPRNEFDKMATEFFRVLKPNGVCIHRVDLKDHLGGKLNNLRFSESTWEGMLFRKSGFYTNRIRFSEMATIFRNAGFDCHLPRVVRWEKVPTPRSMMAVQFRELCDDELLVSSFDIVLRK